MTPDKHTNQEVMIDVGEGHQLWACDWGNPDAKTPIIFLHGGPGGSSSDGQKQRFDPAQHRVIFFDQRGAGKSLPAGSLEHNTTAELVEDISKVADHFQIEQFMFVGASWGSTLALCYAIEHPERVAGMVLSGIYTATEAENAWIDRGGFEAYFPDLWTNYVAQTPDEGKANPGQYYQQLAQSDDPEVAKRAAYAYSNLEGALVRMDDRFSAQNYEKFDPAGSLIEMHYLANHCFIPEGFIASNTAKLTMPIWLVQGRYDMVCPPITAYNLHQKLPNSKLLWTMAGHSSNDRSHYDVVHTLLQQIAN